VSVSITVSVVPEMDGYAADQLSALTTELGPDRGRRDEGDTRFGTQ
jgi:hypothetical protein